MLSSMCNWLNWNPPMLNAKNGRRKVRALSHHVWHIPGALLSNKQKGLLYADGIRGVAQQWHQNFGPSHSEAEMTRSNQLCAVQTPKGDLTAHIWSAPRYNPYVAQMLHIQGCFICNLRLRSVEVTPQLCSTAGAPVRWQAQVYWGSYGIYTLRYGQYKSCGCTIVTLYSFQFLMCM